VQKIRDRQLAAPTLSETLQDLVLNELKEKKHTATEGLLWLNRYVPHSTQPYPANNLIFSGLDFTAQALRHNLSNSTKELADSFREAYGKTLKPHHSFIIKPIFSAAMSATPYRKDFYKKLGDDDAKVQTELDKWLAGLEKDISVLNQFLARKEAKW
jgi:hypothetical protein